ncbi:MAG TPA: lysylphosphatidylglycerol synthase transmembrane domain-containing protein [Gaiellaceae bacterium]|nr:lysylphosphatidylglycerol synthase transmembrane domain-containing protein [Gaiellaceae bacterium]
MVARTRPRVSTFALIVAGFVVSAAFTYLAIRNVHPDRVWRGLRESNYWWVAPSVGLLAVSLALRAWRWQFLFGAATRPPYLPVLSAAILGQFFNNVLPARAGEAARVISLNRSTRVSRAETVATVVVERLYDVLVLLVLLFALLPWLPHVTWVHAAAILALALVAGTAVAVLVLVRFGERPLRFVLRPLARLPFVSLERTEAAAASLVRGTASLHNPWLALVALVLTAVSWVLLGLSAWVLMLGFDLGLSPLAGVLVIVAIGLSMILPSSPAAVGVFEAATLVALNAYGVPKSGALSYALVLHAVNFFPYVGAGAVVLQGRAWPLRRRIA